MSFVDLNRSGVALMEIVSRPDMRSAGEARAYVTKLRTILRYLGTCDGNMEEGSLRADVNVSVRRPGSTLGTRCEIKNVNSIRFIGLAIEYETRSMRSKEEAHDYRYFPDPDLLPLEFTQAFVDGIEASLPELPDEKKTRLISDYGLSPYDATVLIGEGARADYFEAVAKGRDAKLAANWVTGELFGALNREGHSIEDTPVSAKQLGELIDLISDGTISGRIAKGVFDSMYKTGHDPAKIVKTEGLQQVTDFGEIEAAIDAVIAANPDKAEQTKVKPQLAGWFVGQVMKSTSGKANPRVVNEILAKKLGLLSDG